jgi:hypothetical protein
MIKFTISRSDNIYACFPDLARTPDGTLVCIYRESMGHMPFPFSRLVCRRSIDDGKTWQPRSIIDECVVSDKAMDENRSWLWPDVLHGYEESLARVTAPEKIGAAINCPRLICLRDGQLLLIADRAIYEGDNRYRWSNLTYRSFDAGQTWAEPEETGLAGSVPALAELQDGRILLGLTVQDTQAGGEKQMVYFSSDIGKTWSKPVEMPSQSGQNFNEGSFVELDDGTLLGILRDDSLGRGYKVLSSDGGQTWKGPFPTQLIGLIGRPKADLLHSGEVCITYRVGLPNEMLALHLMTQNAARVEGESPMIPRQPMPEDKPDIATEAWFMNSYYPGRTLILDMDRSVHRDMGYSGWAQLDNGDIFVVDYTNDDGYLAQIRGYRVSRADIILFPEGDLPWVHPGHHAYPQLAQAMAQHQMEKNAKRAVDMGNPSPVDSKYPPSA